MDTKFNEKESLALISEMIEQARGNIQKGSGNVMIFWGFYIAFIALLNVILLLVLPNPNHSFWVWILSFFGWVIDRFLDKKVDKNTIVKTHIDRIITATWKAMGISIVLFLIIINGYIIAMNVYTEQSFRLSVLITPVIMLLTGVAEFITSKACRFKLFLKGAVIMWAGALCCLLSYMFFHSYSYITQFIILAICMITGFVIPGYRLNKSVKKNV